MREEIINSDLIDYYRKNTSAIFYNNLGNEKNEIVPKQFEHWHLINSNNIDESIYKYYHYPTRKMLTQIEFDEIKKKGFAGRKETAIKPYNIVFCGAYHFLPNFLNKLASIAFLEKYKPKINGKTITSIYDLKPYFEEYAKGFEQGFNDFDTDEIKPFLTLISDKQDYVFKVFDYVTKSISFAHGWATLSNGFTTDGLNNHEIVDALENGKKEGYFYKAWSIILSNNNLFAPLFQNFLKEEIEEVKLDLRTEYENYKGSNLELKNNNLEIPIKYTISGIDCYFYNKTLFCLFELKVEKDGIKPDDFADFYKDGFVKGLNFLNDEVQIILQDLRDERKRKNTINEIKNILYYREFSPLKNGIIKTVFDTIPLIFTKTSTYNYGYYNGIMHSLEDLFKKAGLTKDDLMNEAESIPAPQQNTDNEDQTQVLISTKNLSFRSFEDLFYNPDLVEQSINILAEVEPPLIDLDKNFIGSPKGAICVWIDELKKQGILKNVTDRKILADLIPSKIRNFSIDESMFGKPQMRAEEKYKTEFKTLISQIKLSQNSQNGGLGK